jgi:hypothetical protein
MALSLLPPLLLWLDASIRSSFTLLTADSLTPRVELWNDLTGVHSAAPWAASNVTAPLYSHNSVTFDNTNNYLSPTNKMLQVSPVIPGAFVRTIIVAFRLADLQDPQCLFRQNYQGQNDPQFLVRFGLQAGLALVQCSNGSRAISLTGQGLSLNATHVVTVVNSATGLRVWVDGNLTGTATTPLPSTCFDTPSVPYPLATIGGWYTDNSFVTGGAVGEVQFYSGALSDTTRSVVEALVLAKWRLIWGN